MKPLVLNQIVIVFQDTSLVYVVALHDFLTNGEHRRRPRWATDGNVYAGRGRLSRHLPGIDEGARASLSEEAAQP